MRKFIFLLADLTGDGAYAIDSNCTRNELMATTIAIAKIGDSLTRLSTLKSLAENWRFSLPDLMRELESIKRDGGPDLGWNIALSGTVRNILATYDQAIPLFRRCDDAATVKPLVWAARGADRNLRLNSSNILANTIDNTTVCFVLHHLYQDSLHPQLQLNDEGRANLLGITRAMASYAYLENVKAIQDVLAMLQKQLGDRLKERPQTASLIANIAERASSSQNRTTPLPPSLQQYCKNFRYDASLE